MIQPEKIHILSINIIKAHLETSEEYLENPEKVSPEAFEFGFGRDIAHNFDAGRSRYRLYFHLNGKNKAGEDMGLTVDYGIEIHFLVENFETFVKKSEGRVQLDADLGATLLGMAFSTARGIIFERTRGTFFEGIILPVIDPYKALIQKEYAIEEKEK